MNCYAIENHPNDSRATIDPQGIVQTLSSRMGTGGNNTPFVLITSMNQGTQNGNRTQSQASEKREEAAETEVKESLCYAVDSHPMDSRIGIVDGACPSVTCKLAKLASDGPLVLIMNSSGDGIAAPLDASYYKGQGLRQGIEREYVMMKAYCAGNGQLHQTSMTETMDTLDCMHDQKMVIIDRHYYTKQRHDQFIDGHVASSLKSRDYKEYTDVIQEDCMEDNNKKYVLRRLTPTECARLQGFPDWWCDGANGSDSAQYKLWGNGIALPCACDILGRIAEEIRNNAEE